MIQYKTLSDLLRQSNAERSPVSEEFDVFTFQELGEKTHKMMPSHRRDFFTIIYMKDQKTGQVSINQDKHTQLNNTLLFQGKEHIFSFVRDRNIEGGIILFHASFLLPYFKSVGSEFAFFNVTSPNYFHLSAKEKMAFDKIFRFLLEERNTLSVAKAILMAFLEKAKILYQAYGKEEGFLSTQSILVRRYKQLIAHSFIEHRDVGYYANQLNISANYLNEVVKSETGKSAKKHLSERLLLEAKNLLLYSEMDISEISHTLQFSEPTHFTKFFKKETQLTPKAFQNSQP